jgi:uncharacterized protein
MATSHPWSSILVGVLLGATAPLSSGCSRTPPEPTPTTTATEPQSAKPGVVRAADSAQCPPDPEPNVSMPMGEVSFPDAPSTPHVDVELAKNPHDVERGLMYRRSMADTHGMLFKLEGRRDHTFWMHNTCIPLDMLFVDDDGVIVGIVEGAAPLTDSVRSVGFPSSFVLEVNGGWTRKRGIKPGQKLTLPSSIR